MKYISELEGKQEDLKGRNVIQENTSGTVVGVNVTILFNQGFIKTIPENKMFIPVIIAKIGSQEIVIA